MKNKERARDIGAAERRILQPRMARKMDSMSADDRLEFDRRVEASIEGLVKTARRHYTKRQQKLDETGVFHPEVNAHRWAVENIRTLTDRPRPALTTIRDPNRPFLPRRLPLRPGSTLSSGLSCKAR